MYKFEDNQFYYVAFNIFLIFAINPFLSPIVLKGNDLQLPVYIIAAFIFGLDVIRKDLYISKVGLLILFASIASLIYILPSSFIEYNLRGQLNFLLGFFIFYTFFKYKHLLDKRFFNLAVFINFFGIFWHYFFTISFLSIANIVTRKIKIEEFEGRGPSGFASEPLYAAASCFFICMFSKYLFRQKKISKLNDFMIQLISLFCILLTKSGTGYIFVLFLIMFVYFGLSFRALIIKLILVFVSVIILSYLASSLNFNNRGINLLSDLLFVPRDFFCDVSVSTRIISIFWGIYSLLSNPLGNGVGSSDYITATIETIRANYIFANYLAWCDFRQESGGVSSNYAQIYGLISNNENIINPNSKLLLVDITSYIFMSNFGIYIYEYGILFLIFIFFLFYINFDKNYVNYAFTLGAFLSVSTSLSLAFPGFWILMCFAKKERNKI